MKILRTVSLVLVSTGTALCAQLFDSSKLAPKTYVELKDGIEASSKILLEKIAAEDWRAVYQSTSQSIRDAISESQFVERNDYKAAVSTSLSLVDKVMMVEENGPEITIYCQAIYREVSSTGTTLFHSLTWRFDMSSRKWLCLNLPFDRFKYLPIILRFRF